MNSDSTTEFDMTDRVPGDFLGHLVELLQSIATQVDQTKWERPYEVWNMALKDVKVPSDSLRRRQLGELRDKLLSKNAHFISEIFPVVLRHASTSHSVPQFNKVCREVFSVEINESGHSIHPLRY